MSIPCNIIQTYPKERDAKEASNDYPLCGGEGERVVQHDGTQQQQQQQQQQQSLERTVQTLSSSPCPASAAFARLALRHTDHTDNEPRVNIQDRECDEQAWSSNRRTKPCRG